MSVFSISMQLMLCTILCSAWLNSAPVCSFLLHSPLLYYPYSTLLILCSAQSAHNCTHALNTLQRSSCNRFLQVVHCKHLNSVLQSNRHQCKSRPHSPRFDLQCRSCLNTTDAALFYSWPATIIIIIVFAKGSLQALKMH